MNNTPDRNGSLNNSSHEKLSKRDQLLADVTALALGQTDKTESEKIQARVDSDPELKTWFDEVDSVANLVRRSNEVVLPKANSDLRSLIEDQLGGAGTANLGASKAIQKHSSEVELDQTDEHLSVKSSANSPGNNGTRRALTWFAGIAASIVLTSIVFFTLNPQHYERIRMALHSENAAQSPAETTGNQRPRMESPVEDQNNIETEFQENVPKINDPRINIAEKSATENLGRDEMTKRQPEQDKSLKTDSTVDEVQLGFGRELDDDNTRSANRMLDQLKSRSSENSDESDVVKSVKNDQGRAGDDSAGGDLVDKDLVDKDLVDKDLVDKDLVDKVSRAPKLEDATINLPSSKMAPQNSHKQIKRAQIAEHSENVMQEPLAKQGESNLRSQQQNQPGADGNTADQRISQGQTENSQGLKGSGKIEVIEELDSIVLQGNSGQNEMDSLENRSQRYNEQIGEDSKSKRRGARGNAANSKYKKDSEPTLVIPPGVSKPGVNALGGRNNPVRGGTNELPIAGKTEPQKREFKTNLSLILDAPSESNSASGSAAPQSFGNESDRQMRRSGAGEGSDGLGGGFGRSDGKGFGISDGEHDEVEEQPQFFQFYKSRDGQNSVVDMERRNSTIELRKKSLGVHLVTPADAKPIYSLEVYRGETKELDKTKGIERYEIGSESKTTRRYRRADHSETLDAIESDDDSLQDSDEDYELLPENEFYRPIDKFALSTFSIDVDSASYSNIRRMINNGRRPNPRAVRVEEMVNYFQYDYPEPEGNDPFFVNMELADCPWKESHQLLRIGLKAREIHRAERPNSNLVFLVDVSGSMSDENKLPLLKRGLQMMIDRLGESDRVSIVTYAGNAGVALEPTSGDQKKVLRDAIEQLSSGGSTNGSAGIIMAYEMAERNFLSEGVNRVILATDGDLNVGITDDSALVKLIKEKAQSNVFLSVFGFGTGNLKDAKLEKLADNGNGLYAYIDSTREAHRVLVEQMSGSLVTVAKDVKLQLEFNPAEVKAYRLIGYENRVMANADFHDDKKDAGEIGAGHTVTALYEIVPTDAEETADVATYEAVKLKYQTKSAAEEVSAEITTSKRYDLTEAAKSGELLTLWLNYKRPESDEREADQQFTIKAGQKSFEDASNEFRFASAVASFGMLLRNSKFSGSSNLESVERIGATSLGEDQSGYRAEFVDLVRALRSKSR